MTWYKITHAGKQVAQLDFQNKGRSRWTGTSCIVLEVPLRNLFTSMCDLIPCDGNVQRAHWHRLFTKRTAASPSVNLNMAYDRAFAQRKKQIRSFRLRIFFEPIWHSADQCSRSLRYSLHAKALGIQ